MKLKSFIAALAVTTALTFPAFAQAAETTFATTLRDFSGNGAYLAYYLTDAKGKYVRSLWVAGSKTRYYDHLDNWYRLTRSDQREISGITGASVGAGRSLKFSADLADALFDAGYQLHIDTAVEDMRDGPNEVVVPLTSAGSGHAVKGARYIAEFTYQR